MADDENLLDWHDGIDDIDGIDGIDATDDGLDGALRVTDAPGSERSARLWRAFLRHRRPVLSGALVVAVLALLGVTFAREGAFAPGPALISAAGVARATQVSASSPYATLGPAPNGTLIAYHLTTPGVGMMQPAVDANGDLWFGEMRTNRLTRVNHMTGQVTSWTPPSGRNNITKVVIDRAGSVWFVEQLANYIASFDPRTQGFVVYPLSSSDGGALLPQDLAFDSHGALWFTTLGAGDGGAIGRLDPSNGAIQYWPTRDPNARWKVRPFSLALTPSGEVWFGLLAGGAVGRLDPATGETSYYPLANPRATVFSMAVDARNRIYFTELLDGKLGVINAAARTVSERAIPQTFGSPASLYGVVAGPPGVVWFASAGANALIRYEPRRNLLTFYQLSEPGSAPFGLALDGQHRLWYTANGADANFLGLLTV
jgi:streptogramin lyase